MGHGGDDGADACGATLDRSKVHILLCDKDSESGLQVMTLLQKCSYQVTFVKSAGQLMEVLDSSSLEVDLILAEVELPKEKGFKLLKHIVRQEQLQRIPVVMMSFQDEMALVVRCLKLGAVDFLLKPLRSNELLNLWTHTWRRRRMLGLTEKHLMKGRVRVPYDLLVAETSESNNTNSPNLFSDDTEDHQMATLSAHPVEIEISPRLALSLKPSVDASLEVTSENGAGSMPSPPRKSELKVGQSSAFLTYNKLSNPSIEGAVVAPHVDVSRPTGNSLYLGHELLAGYHEKYACCKNNEEEGDENDDPILSIAPSDEPFADRLHFPLASTSYQNGYEVGFREQLGRSGNYVPLPGESPGGKPYLYCSEGAAGGTSNSVASHFLAGGMMGSAMHCTPPVLPPAAVPIYQSLSTGDDLPCSMGIAAGIPSIHMPQGSNLSSTFPFYPFGLHMAVAPAPGLQLGGSISGWLPAMQSLMFERKLGQAERREAALNKFRLKRKDRCFEKKIRYVSRKKLAEQRPRIRGQFVRRDNDADINDTGAIDEYDEEDEQGLGHLGDGSSPESAAEDA